MHITNRPVAVIWQGKTVNLYLCAAYLANSEVQKSGVSTYKKQGAIGLLFKESISLIAHSRAL